MHADGGVDVEHAEDLVEHGNEDAAAADTEQTGEKAGDHAGGKQRDDEQRELARGKAQVHGDRPPIPPRPADARTARR